MEASADIRFLAAIPSGLEIGVPPREFLIFAYGTTETTNGNYSFDKDAADAVMLAAADYGNRLTLDYEHQALSKPPVIAPAAGRYRLELRDDGLWAVDVEWTPEATRRLSSKEYLYYSPAFVRDDKGRPKRLLNVALTNLPATKNMTPLVAAKRADDDGDFDEDKMKKCTACNKDMGDGDALYCSACSAARSMMGQLAALTGKATNAEQLAIVQGWKVANEEIAQLRAEMAQQKAAAEAQAFDAEIANAKASALLAPSDEHKRNKAALAFKGKPGAVEMLRSFLSAFDPLVDNGKGAAVQEPVKVPDSLALTDEEKRIATKMGISLDKLAENKKRRAQLALNAPANPLDDEDDKDAA